MGHPHSLATITEGLPYCQDLGEHLNQANSADAAAIAGRSRDVLAYSSPDRPPGKTSKVVIMAIRIKNFYDEIGATSARLAFDEARELETQA